MKMRRFLALLMVAAMLILCVACSSGGNTPAETDSADNSPTGEVPSDGGDSTMQKWLIGTNIWGTGPPVLEMMNDASLYAIGNFGCEAMGASDDFSSDNTIANVQRFIGAGCDGLNLYNCAAATLPTISQMAADAGIPFSLHTGIGTEDQFPILTENENFAGAVDANCVLAGEQMAQMAYDDGCRTAVMIGGNIGDVNHDQRSEGFRTTFEALGGTVLDEARCTDASEATTKAGDLLSANRDADAIYCFVGDYVPGSVTAKTDLGLDDLKIYVSNVDGDTAQMIKDGTCAGGNDGTSMPPMIGAALVMNYLDGCKLVDSNGLAVHYQTTPIIVTSENVDLYMDVFCTEGQQPIADSLMQSLLYRYNPDLTYESFYETVTNGLTLDDLAAAHGLA